MHFASEPWPGNPPKLLMSSLLSLNAFLKSSSTPFPGTPAAQAGSRDAAVAAGHCSPATGWANNGASRASRVAIMPRQVGPETQRRANQQRGEMKRPAAQIGVALTRVRIEARCFASARTSPYATTMGIPLVLVAATRRVFIDGLRTLYPDLDYDTLPGPGLQRERRERERLLRALIES